MQNDVPLIRVYADKFSPDCEVNQAMPGQSFSDYLTKNVPDYEPRHARHWSVVLNGMEPLAPDQWQRPLMAGDVLDVYIEPKDPVTAIYATIVIISALYAYRAAQNIPDSYNSTTPSGSSIYEVNAQGNRFNLMGVVPHVLGRHKTMPDYLNLPRREYQDHQQVLHMMLSVGYGDISVEESTLKIGDTPISRLGDIVDYQIFQPGQSVSGHPAHRSEYQVKEVGGSDGRSGLELVGTSFDENSGQYYVVVVGAKRLQRRNFNTRPYDFFGDKYPGNHVGKVIEVYNWFGNSDPLHSVFYKVVAQNDEGEGDPDSWIEVERCDIHGNIEQGWSGFPSSWVGTAISNNFRVIYNNYGAYLGWFAAAPDSEGTTQCRLDFRFNQGLGYVTSGGGVSNASVSIRVERRASPGAPVSSEIHTFTDNTLDQRAYTLSYNFPAGSQPEFRIRRLTEDDRGLSYKDSADWAGLRSELDTATVYPNWTTMAITIKGDNRLGSAAENKISLVGTTKIPALQHDELSDQFSWSSPAPSQNPTDIALHIARLVGKTDAQLDLDEYWRCRQIWQTRSDTFAAVIDNETTFWKMAERILRVGFAEPLIDFERFSLVRDEQRTYYQHTFQADNLLTDFSYEADLYDNDEHDGYEVEYMSDQTWKPETIMCALPGVTPKRLKKLRLLGVTSRTKAYQLGMRALAEQLYRRIVFKFGTEMDGLNCRRKDFCALGVDEPGLSQTGRIIGVSGRVLRTNQPVSFGQGNHYMIVRRPDGSGQQVIAMPGGDDYSVLIDRNLDFRPVLDGSMEPPLYQFGEAETVTVPVKIREITPRGTDRVSIVAVDDRPEVYQWDDAEPL